MKAQKVYLDANFLVYWLVSKTQELKKRARILLASLLAQKASLALSPLSFDEAWEGIRKELSKTSSQRLSHFHPDVYSSLEEITDKILDHSSFEVIQLQDCPKGVKTALDNIKEFQLRPRDAFHLSMMRDNNISKIVTSDEKFIKQQESMGIEVILIKNAD